MILEVDDNALHFIKQCFFFISNKNFIGKKKKKKKPPISLNIVMLCLLLLVSMEIYRCYDTGLQFSSQAYL